MTPVGHAAAGYLSAALAIKITHLPLSPAEANMLLGWGVFFGVIPDIDAIPFFITRNSFRLNVTDSHRNYPTHAPLLWACISLLIFSLAGSAFYKAFGLVMLFSSWSHFLGDSIEYGIMWLWPFRRKLMPFRRIPPEAQIASKDISLRDWMASAYPRSVTAYVEIAVILASLLYRFG